jgi:Putative Actinobacterial Holin-X, holin superfamily III
MAYPDDSRTERAVDARVERAASSDSRSVPELLSDLVNQTTTLFKKEGELIRAEMSEKVSQILGAAGALAAGGILLLVALIVLALALVHAVSQIGDMGVGWASLIVGLALAVVGALLLMKGKNSLDAGNLAPRRTLHQVKRDADLVKEQV